MEDLNLSTWLCGMFGIDLELNSFCTPPSMISVEVVTFFAHFFPWTRTCAYLFDALAQP